MTVIDTVRAAVALGPSMRRAAADIDASVRGDPAPIRPTRAAASTRRCATPPSAAASGFARCSPSPPPTCSGCRESQRDPRRPRRRMRPRPLARSTTICPAWTTTILRRGKPTVHRAYDEATAVLAGDALLALAFEITRRSRRCRVSGEIRAELVCELARAAGAAGMAGGQMLDLLPGRARSTSTPSPASSASRPAP